jgi:C-terminal processing protease CtpA/Prc
VTSARWYTPQRAPLDQTGLPPDILAEPSSDDLANGRDAALAEAIAYLQGRQALP